MNYNSNEKKLYNYELISNYETKKYYIEGLKDLKSIKKLIIYLEKQFEKALPYSVLSLFDIKDILTSCYGFEEVADNTKSKEINLDQLYNNEFSKEQVTEICNDKKHEAKGLTGKLREIIDFHIEIQRVL